MTSLQLLNLSECNSLDGLDSSIQSLADLRRLMLRGCHLMTSLPHEMTKLSSLKLIDLRECTSLQTLSFLPATLEKLFLDDCSRLETVSASLPNLQQLHVSRCRNLRRLPTELGASMRVLYVERCYALHEMLATEQQSFFGDLSSLEDLDLRECTSLKTLSFLPTTLQSLWLNGCSSLQTVNASLPMLQKFYALKCSNLRRLPTELGTCMRELGLKACDGLSEWLATNHEELLSLEHLDLRECTSLETLFFLPTTMQTLWLSGCSSLQAVNGSLPKLQEFYAGKCSNLRTLPKELGGYMRELCLEGCEGLSEWLATNKASLLFGELSSLDHLDLRECTSLETLSLLPTTLQTLWLTGCSRLRTVNGSLPMLQKLYASKCSKLRTLPTELGTCMRELGLKACDGLSEWLATNQASLLFGELSSLEHLDLRECTSLETLPFLPTTLKTLWLTGCKSLQAVNGSLPKLQEFYAGECSNLRTLPKELGACMRELCLEGCDGLSEWLATDEASSLFGELSSLEHLDLKACTSLKTLSFLPTTLKTLWLNGCSNLQSVSASLPKLQQFYARKCSSLRTLPTELGACMRALGLEGCDGLSQWLATKNASLLFCELLSLEHLDLRECTSLETLPFLPTTMQTLWLTGCSRLQAVNGSLPKLQEFYAEKCSKLRTLPKELGACMRELCLKGCDGLSEWLATDEASLLFEELCSLKKLDLSWCINLKALSFLPTSLEELTLEGCIQLEVLRFGSGNLTNLKRLDIRYCASLRSLPQELESLPALTIKRDDAARRLHRRGGLPSRIKNRLHQNCCPEPNGKMVRTLLLGASPPSRMHILGDCLLPPRNSADTLVDRLSYPPDCQGLSTNATEILRCKMLKLQDAYYGSGRLHVRVMAGRM
ncbi:hypothetical protein KP509_15G027100 [Ceratopteris richardii]|nr:hypothetical protein KP509_15G027100 [Ceratopteris richardii]